MGCIYTNRSTMAIVYGPDLLSSVFPRKTRPLGTLPVGPLALRLGIGLGGVLGQKGRARRCESVNRDEPRAGTNTVTYDFKRLIATRSC